jgi:hypothetical protein
MANHTAEILMPDGDGDEQRGIDAAEMHANLSKADGSLRTTEDISRQNDATEDTPVRGSRALYVDQDYIPRPDSTNSDAHTKWLREQAERRAQAARLPRGWMSGMALEASVYTGTMARRRRLARRGGHAALRIMPGGGFGSPTL